MALRCNTFLMVVACLLTADLFVCSASFAQEAAAQGTISSEKAVLQGLAKTPEVAEELDEPDGVSVEGLDTDNWKVFARGTGTYAFNDADNRKDATEEAILEAKAALVKYLKESVTTESQMDKLAEEESKQSNANGATTLAVTKTRMKTTLSRIHNSADRILSGILTLETTYKWEGASGEVRVTLGQSEKSLAAAEKFAIRTDDSLKRVEQAAAASGTTKGSIPNGKTNGAGKDEPTTIKRKSKSDF